mmetsp:Transcript_25737/g.78225  ORF Transcript_25737/g.78225 Transcript_25737/m.78225 type:complete len:126 (-) Transcript_25737:1091-1468(-)
MRYLLYMQSSACILVSAVHVLYLAGSSYTYTEGRSPYADALSGLSIGEVVGLPILPSPLPAVTIAALDLRCVSLGFDVGIEQSEPLHPELHTHQLRTHSPWPEHWFRQTERTICSQPAPARPSKH